MAAILKPKDKKKDKSNITKVIGGGTFTKTVSYLCVEKTFEKYLGYRANIVFTVKTVEEADIKLT